MIADRYALSNAELAALTPGLTAGSSLMVGQKINVPLNEVEELTASSKKTEKSNRSLRTLRLIIRQQKTIRSNVVKPCTALPIKVN